MGSWSLLTLFYIREIMIRFENIRSGRPCKHDGGHMGSFSQK
ncbi:hypothetical protein HMPREF1981_02561 [Bacteroides pyogenes F0041]|uniref:Uncharacterized protein n=1 Tax=Bacteroides pyogenes F0041 TaxID=1321819 RepID=U2C020_9BACE|nr:hypothetical protein HMPREF1981_02561 [Bacteroides pyogenes F0041]